MSISLSRTKFNWSS